MSTPSLVVIDYGLGNLGSVANALRRIGAEFEVSADPMVVRAAKALILPGVGAAGAGMRNLRARGLNVAVTEAVRAGTPLLGLCLGMQLLFDRSDEDNVDCLGLIPGRVKRFTTERKVPHMGWNQVEAASDSVLLRGLPPESFFYFVHSYVCEPWDPGVVTGRTDYAGRFCSVLEQGRIFGAQFHPEKSADAGEALLRNFWEVVC